jgi:hypothetical protein
MVPHFCIDTSSECIQNNDVQKCMLQYSWKNQHKTKSALLLRDLSVSLIFMKKSNFDHSTVLAIELQNQVFLDRSNLTIGLFWLVILSFLIYKLVLRS